MPSKDEKAKSTAAWLRCSRRFVMCKVTCHKLRWLMSLFGGRCRRSVFYEYSILKYGSSTLIEYKVSFVLLCCNVIFYHPICLALDRMLESSRRDRQTFSQKWPDSRRENACLPLETGGENFATPVQTPSMVLVCASRIPSLSSSRAHSRLPRVQLTVL